MIINDNLMSTTEKIIFALRELYATYGYTPYCMSKFEAYDLYANHKDFLVSENIISFNDTDGKLLALKPDVTLSIIKNSPRELNTCNKVYYNENVYHVSKRTDAFSEIMQSGIECFGKVSDKDIEEVLILAAQSLKLLSEDAVLAISDLSIISSIIDAMALSKGDQKDLYFAVGSKNAEAIQKIAEDNQALQQGNALIRLISLNGDLSNVEKKLEGIDFCDKVALENFIQTLNALSKSDYSDMIRIDFSLTGDLHYYNGIIFKGFLPNIPYEVLSGGQYDRLMQRMNRNAKAIGFAVYHDMLSKKVLTGTDDKDDFVNIALPKGRLGEKIYGIFAENGLDCPSILEPGRKLIFENTDKKLRFFWAKPSDVPIYVERGAADLGVAGKDILVESDPDVYEMLDLKEGKCRMCVSAPKDFTDDPFETLRVATKFSNTAKQYYRKKGRETDIIHLNGSIEIAPVLKVSDVIVDIVETGTTLKENGLEVKETIFEISARLIANKASYKFKQNRIEEIVHVLKKGIQ